MELMFSKTHEWVQWLNEEKTSAYIGISEYAAKKLGDIVYVGIDEEDAVQGERVGDVESVKAVSDFFSPFTGEISEINSVVIDNPAILNIKPEETWICKVDNITASLQLLSKVEYDNLDKE
ncbi:MAG: glycine cleavage system protein H [Sphaerochaeta sp.]